MLCGMGLELKILCWTCVATFSHSSAPDVRVWRAACDISGPERCPIQRRVRVRAGRCLLRLKSLFGGWFPTCAKCCGVIGVCRLSDGGRFGGSSRAPGLCQRFRHRWGSQRPAPPLFSEEWVAAGHVVSAVVRRLDRPHRLTGPCLHSTLPRVLATPWCAIGGAWRTASDICPWCTARHGAWRTRVFHRCALLARAFGPGSTKSWPGELPL